MSGSGRYTSELRSLSDIVSLTKVRTYEATDERAPGSRCREAGADIGGEGPAFPSDSRPLHHLHLDRVSGRLGRKKRLAIKVKVGS